jgi:hypothetical protein
MTTTATPPRAGIAQPWVVVAGVIVLLAAAAAVLASVSSIGRDDSTTRLTAGPAQAKCPPPEPERLAERADLAFAGRVTGISEGVVTLRVTQIFTGTAAATVAIAQTSGASDVLLGGNRFEEGKAYLVASVKGDMIGCGYSGVDDARQRELYETAF